jgi:hypothetical protein
MRVTGSVAGAIALALHATSIAAGESVIGRWALDLASCGHDGETAASSPLIVTDDAVRWFSDACRISRMYKTGDTVHIQALCWGRQGKRSVPVSLRPHGGRLQVRWDRNASGDMRRCP